MLPHGRLGGMTQADRFVEGAVASLVPSDVQAHVLAVLKSAAPRALCLPCLARQVTAPEPAVRNAAQVLVLRLAGTLRVIGRVCHRCGQPTTVMRMTPPQPGGGPRGRYRTRRSGLPVTEPST